MQVNEATAIIKRLQGGGMTIEEIAARSGISYSSVYRYSKRNGKKPHRPYLKLLRNLEAEENEKSK